jgi:prephenate dehydratase
MNKKIAFQGRPGAYSESACYHLFGKDSSTMPCRFFEDLYKAVESGDADGAVIPIENSTAGSIYENFDLLLKYKLPIISEVKIRVEHVLMAVAGSRISDLTEVRSHPQALAQCSYFFKEHPHIKAVSAFDTAGSAEEIALSGEMNKGAIASEMAAKEYGLEILQRQLENTKQENFTRFLALVKEAPMPATSEEIKTTLVFAPKVDEVGVLYRALGFFAEANIDLFQIESRPRENTPWHYVFYLSLKGHPKSEATGTAIAKLREISSFVHILGVYPAGADVNLSYERK